jgi:hypothetical protein
MCPTCVMDRPCICDKDRIVAKMREYYEKHRRSLFRREPRGYRNWGEPDDVLMGTLYRIARDGIEAAQLEQRKIIALRAAMATARASGD